MLPCCLLASSVAIERLDAILVPWSVYELSHPPLPEHPYPHFWKSEILLAHSGVKFQSGMCGHGSVIYLAEYLVDPFNLRNSWFKFWDVLLDYSFEFLPSVVVVLFALLSGKFPTSWEISSTWSASPSLSFKFLHVFIFQGPPCFLKALFLFHSYNIFLRILMVFWSFLLV